MSDLAERIRAGLAELERNPPGTAGRFECKRQLVSLFIEHAPTILAGLAALEVVNSLRIRLSAVQFNYASELGIQAESLMQLEQSLGESFESLGDAIASAVAALEERDKLRALLARCDVHMRLARVPGLVELVPNPLSAEIAAALQPTPETNKEK